MESAPAAAPGPSSAPSLREEPLCAVCSDPSPDAVTLDCGHNFCLQCVSRCWAEQPTPACPACRGGAAPPPAPRTHPALNRLLANVRLGKGAAGLGQGGLGRRPARRCRPHRAEFSHYCWEDKELLCGTCGVDARHQEHRVQSLEEAARSARAKCKNMEHTLQQKTRAFSSTLSSYEAVAKHNQDETAWLEGRIHQEFEKLQEFLRAEEKATLDMMAEDSKEKQLLMDQKIKDLTRGMEALNREIKRLKMEMREDDISFLLKHKARKRRLFYILDPDPLQPGMLIDVCKYLGSLQYRVWKKMISFIEVVPITLDPNTASGWLSVHDDLASVSNQAYWRPVGNPDRFSSAPALMGSQVFSEGYHAWEVSVGELQNWRVGVMRVESEIGEECYTHNCFYDTRSGFWYLYHMRGQEDDICIASEQGIVILPLPMPHRLRVELECEDGELSFYDVGRQCHIYTFHACFGTVRPYFYIGPPQENEAHEPLRICPLQVTIREELDG
ncbi:E3 ubiquitin-protein ligase TRIM35 [Perognathus longimembris pacificus]|uniref:E3 ubiquitin-protein ligase TRIM35 n=1 Tax=Perognathus longimembris pacificus TaxID=214514 RepID=UPI002019E79D|nr:E3 ubiquitin-protein ligase TRIM35 [Perognathus longimembris pacificus]